MRGTGGQWEQKKPEQEPLLCLMVPNNVTWNERPRRTSGLSCLTRGTPGRGQCFQCPHFHSTGDNEASATVGIMFRPLANRVF